MTNKTTVQQRANLAKALKEKGKAKLGSGSRFKELVAKLKAQGNKNPEALAAYIGRQKYGKAAFQAMSKAGK